MKDCTILKIGGSSLEEDRYLERLASYLVEQQQAGQEIVVVHGGGPQIQRLHEQLGVRTSKADGLRATPDESMPLVTMVLRGLVNTRVVARLVARGLPALGLSGVDLGLMSAKFLNRSVLGRVGGPPRVQAGRLHELLAGGFIPVLAPICVGPDHLPVNVNADTVAHALAVSVQAQSLDFATDVDGVRVADRVIPRLSADRIHSLVSRCVIRGGMIPKIQAAAAAARAGVPRVRIGSFQALDCCTATEIHL